MTKSKKILFILILTVLALGLGACTGRRVVTSGWSGVTIQEESIFFSSGPQVYSLDLNNGAQQWQYPVEPIAGVDFYAAPVLAPDGEQLILASYKNEIHSVNPENGLKAWSYSIPEDNKSVVRFIASPLVTEEGVFAPASNNILYALDFEGNLDWEFQTEEPLWASPIWSENCNCLYLASMDHHVYALDSDTGALLWKTEDLGGPIVSAPALSDTGLILVSTFNNEVIALDENSHQVEWRFQTSNWAWASPLIDGEQVYISDISGTFYALELATGNALWQVQPGGGIYSAPLIIDEMIYLSTDTSSLVVIDVNGVVQRTQPFEGKLYASPVSAGDKILLAPIESEYYLIALNQNGVQVWGYPPAN